MKDKFLPETIKEIQEAAHNIIKQYKSGVHGYAVEIYDKCALILKNKEDKK